MTYSTNPEQDAARHIDAAASEDRARNALRSAMTDDIISAFTEQVRVVGPSNVPLPHPSSRAVCNVFTEAVDLVAAKDIGDLFAAVLQLSDCPHVSELRKAMGEEYARMWVDDLVEGEM